MYYYEPNDRAPRWWAIAAAACYAALLTAAFAWVSFDFAPAMEKPADTILVEFVEPPAPEPPKPPKSVAEPRMHDAPAPVERTAQIAGNDPATRTPNPKALFSMNKSGPDEPADAGNPRAPEGEEQASGTGPGLNPDGLDQVDKGLQGRGLVGALPRPSYPGTQSGKVVVRVTVGPDGRVTSADFEPKGSTVSDRRLIEAARAAAFKARSPRAALRCRAGP